MTVINLGYYSVSPYGLFPYTEPLALDFLGLETYMLGKIEKYLGLECIQASYNNGLLRIMWEIASDGIASNNYTGSTAASVDKGVINLKSDITEQYYQTISASNQYFTFDIGLNLTTLIDTFALISTNLTNSAVITIKGSGSGSEAAPSDWAPIPVMLTIKPSIDPLEENVIYIATTQPILAYRHFRVDIHDPTNPDGFLRIGRCIAGTSFYFVTENCLDTISYKKENYKDEFKINGFTSIANNRSLKKGMTITFKDLDTVAYVNYQRLMNYANYCRDTLKALVIIDPRSPYKFSVFAKLKSMPDESHNYISDSCSYASLTLSYDEAK